MMRGPCLFITSLLGLLVVASSARNETSFCKRPPSWRIGDEEPMGGAMGQVAVVALLQASCSFCLVQAANMGPLRDKLSARGLTNISYIIVNDQSLVSKLMYPELKRRAPAGIPVYDQLPNQEDVWEILDGNKDDFLIYDRCGRLTFHIRLPFSYLFYPYVEAAIISTYFEDYCQNCSFYSNITKNKLNETFVNSMTDVTPEQRPEKDDQQENKPGDRHHHHREGREEEEEEENNNNQQAKAQEAPDQSATTKNAINHSKKRENISKTSKSD
ncbi:selenoprotein Pb-like [Leptodactylus fuscus]|uniref:selenoprotein Pb-like n=1 Tax=Leptodactylus fuscus TaxID=238119 RepID=UPI003F4E7D11